jgi:hypothetical protein
MKSRSVLSAGVALGVFAFAVSGQAQPKNSTPDVLPPASGPETDAPEPKKEVAPAAGYAYSDKPSRGAAAPHGRYRTRGGAVVMMPGFEQTGDGGSRLFVQLSQTVPVEERKAQGTLTYVLKGASPRVWNNTNALVTVHFNTPVSRARLVPQGQDLLFIVDLRASVAPTWKMSESQDKSVMLAIDFPKGDYLGAVSEETKTPTAQPARKKGSKRAPAKNKTEESGTETK